MSVVTKLIKAGITPTCVEFMDNITIKSVEKYLNETLQGSDNGNYIIVEVEGTNEDDLDDKASSSTKSAPKTELLPFSVADHNKIWQARKAFAEAVRAESLIVCKEDVVVPVDQEALLLDESCAWPKVQPHYPHRQPRRRRQHPFEHLKRRRRNL